MLDALKRIDRAHGEPEERPSSTPSIPTPPAQATSGGEEEIPFIEVGPRKSMEASPSVLASASVAAPLLPRGEPIPAAPRTIQFRVLPAYREKRTHFAAELVAYHAPEQMVARQYRAVLDAVRNACASSQQGTALLFTSSHGRMGNTTTLLNLAITAARAGRERVLVVDAQVRRPAVAERLGLPDSPGLREVLDGLVLLDRAVQPTEQANLFALTAGSPSDRGLSFSSQPEEAFQPRFVAQTMRSLLRQARQQFHLVFVDGPPRDGRQDGMMLDTACDAIFVVLPEKEAETPQIDALLQLISAQGGRLGGCILVAGVALSA
jgi:Mrp family chromosome partitioning ATPase